MSVVMLEEIQQTFHKHLDTRDQANALIDDINSKAHGVDFASIEFILMKLHSAMAAWHGVVVGHQLSRLQSTEKATKARKTQGQQRRAKIVEASWRHIGKSKRQASYAIASELNIDFEQIRRTLIDAFPGEQWENRSTHDCKDQR